MRGKESVEVAFTNSSTTTAPFMFIPILCIAGQAMLLKLSGQLWETLEPSPSHVGRIVLEILLNTILKSQQKVPAQDPSLLGIKKPGVA